MCQDESNKTKRIAPENGCKANKFKLKKRGVLLVDIEYMPRHSKVTSYSHNCGVDQHPSYAIHKYTKTKHMWGLNTSCINTISIEN
jgi:hypothetical protein